jgi:transposase InsO family protein
VLRRLDCVLEATKAAVLEAAEQHGLRANPDPILRRAAGDLGFYNVSRLDFRRLLDDPQQIAGSLREYIEVFFNRRRRHSTLGFLSPAQFEDQKPTMIEKITTTAAAVA